MDTFNYRQQEDIKILRLSP